MDEKQVQIFNEIFGALDGALDSDGADGLQILGAVLAMSDDAFEIVKSSLFDTIKSTFNSPEAKIGFAQMMNQQGLRIEDFSNNLDDLVQAVDEMAAEGVELSESKKSDRIDLSSKR